MLYLTLIWGIHVDQCMEKIIELITEVN
jgi:hypothetical protein